MPRALLLFEPPDGGAPEVVLNLALSMERHGWSPCVAGPELTSIRRRLERAGIEYLPVRQLTRGAGSPRADLRALRELDRLLKRDPVDLIHCHSSKAGVLGRLLGARRGVPVVYSPHCFAFLRDLGLLSRLAPAVVETLLSPLTDCYVCVCEAERRASLRWMLTTADRAHRIYNGVPAAEPGVHPDQSLRAFKGDGLLVGAVTALREQKRLDVLIDAIPTVLAAVPRARFAIVGNGPDLPALQAQAAHLGLDEDPRFGFFAFEAPSDRYLSLLDLYVLSSAWEAMPIGVLEAQAWGVPQVVTGVGGTAEAVNGETGRVVPPKRPDALASAIVAMLDSPQTLAAASSASRARHRAMFDADRMVRETVTVYDGVMANGLHRRAWRHGRRPLAHQRGAPPFPKPALGAAESLDLTSTPPAALPFS